MSPVPHLGVRHVEEKLLPTLVNYRDMGPSRQANTVS